MDMNFFKLRFIYSLLMKKYLLYFSILSVAILSWCTDSNVEQTWTWEIATSWAFDSLIQDYSEDMDAPKVQEVDNETNETVEKVENTENTNNTEEVSEQSNTSSWNTVENESWEVTQAPTRPRQSWFWVEECNRIIDFNLCVISKAPIENQEAMKESLQKAVESRKILANAHLREICQKTIEKETFKEVVNHYESLENWCKY